MYSCNSSSVTHDTYLLSTHHHIIDAHKSTCKMQVLRSVAVSGMLYSNINTFSGSNGGAYHHTILAGVHRHTSCAWYFWGQIYTVVERLYSGNRMCSPSKGTGESCCGKGRKGDQNNHPQSLIPMSTSSTKARKVININIMEAHTIAIFSQISSWYILPSLVRKGAAAPYSKSHPCPLPHSPSRTERSSHILLYRKS